MSSLSAPLEGVPKVDVLAIDDNSNNLLLISNMLKDRGYRVRSAPSGRIGLAAAELIAPDVILLDICMPEMDGYEVCRELKRRESLAEVPVIFLSAMGESIDKLRAFGSGGYDYVTKPFNIEEVAARIDTHVSIRRLRQDLQERNQQLREAEKLREQLTHLIVHDLRNPLGVVVLGMDAVLRASRSKLDPSNAMLLESALCQAEVVNRMIDDLLDIGRFEGNKMPMESTEQDISTVVEEARASVAFRGQRLLLDLASAPRTAKLDGDLVRRVLTNLLGNAVKFTPPGGTVEIAVKRIPDGIRFEVRDSGAGISPEYHEMIFDKFGQVGIAQRKTGRSTGLGLTFCKLAVEAHGGQIGVESEPGKGSLFWFTLPQEPEELSKAA